MKTNKLIVLTVFLFCLNMLVHAQFNTIGTINKRPINTANPPKPHVALTDSTVSADSLSHNTMPLVSLPLKNIHINSGFGIRMHPIYHKRIMHNGIDLSARYENVYSMFPGTVIKVGQDNRSGKFVTVRTGDYTISYCHLSQPFVHENDFVDAGSIIAVSGNTGASTGPHLHITAKKDGKAFNPVILLKLVRKIVEKT